MALSGGFLAVGGGGAGGGAAGRQKQRGTEGGRRWNGSGVNRGDHVWVALLRTVGASTDELGAGKRLLKGINQIYPA